MSGSRKERRDHRVWLAAHFVALAVGLGASFAANRFLSPDTFWSGGVAVAWLVAFAIHLGRFARATLATMGDPRRAAGSSATQPSERGA